MDTGTSNGPKIVLLGSESAFTGIVLRHLLDGGADVGGLVIHHAHPPRQAFEPRARELPVVVAGMGPAVALEHNVPVIATRSIHDGKALERVRAACPDLLLVACFALILDEAWLSVPSERCLNLHPSLLPSYRGPTPLFWQFREGEHETGITLHVVEPDLDAGDILAQAAMPLPAGARFSGVNAQLARTGAELVLDLVDKQASGIEVPRSRQDPSLASYQPFPKETDFRFDTHFTAERAFRFIEGTREWGVPFELDAGDATFIISSAIDFHDTARMSEPYEIDAERLRIRCSEGVLEAIGRRAG